MKNKSCLEEIDMKKGIALALSMAMVLGLLTACSGGKEPASASQGGECAAFNSC